MHAYIAGPLFNEGERYWNGEINDRVQKAGFTTYVPQRDGRQLKVESDVFKIFTDDRDQINKADLIVANLDGMDVDAGTAWELGYAHASGKYVIGVYTDWRLHFKFQIVNLMIQCSVNKLAKSLDELDIFLQAFAEENGH